MKRLSALDLHVEILDTTLRDGEQTPGVSFTPKEKLDIARMLRRLKVDRLEIGSARVSEGEAEGVKKILQWSEDHDNPERLEMLGFVDGGRSVEWIRNAGGKVINLLCKGSRNHCEIQLKKSPERHFSDIRREVERAVGSGLKVNLYLEDWSSGVSDSFDYVLTMINFLRDLPVARFMLCDTLGKLNAAGVNSGLTLMFSAFPDLRYDFHGHNDYNMACANALTAVECGISGIHCTINGLGERAGNLDIAQFAVAVKDFSNRQVRIVEKELHHASQLLEVLSGKRCAWNAPVIGSDVFTQTCGVHADGDRKGDLYCNALLPERFVRQRDYALGKLSGKASIDRSLEVMGEEVISQELREKVLNEVIRLGDRKKTVTAADLPFIISNIMRTPEAVRIRIVDFETVSHRHGMPRSHVVLEFDGIRVEGTSTGDGGYDALIKAIRKCLREFGLVMPKLLDYQVRIPPGGRTDALVETTVTWKGPDGRNVITTGVDSDQLVAAAVATEKMLNLMLHGRNDG
ncbi:MAG: 2-isopropylmalate synthase [Lentisphaeria bacterium]|nr:2-isopropylmalate synthase [Lentisphaeria bacterium]